MVVAYSPTDERSLEGPPLAGPLEAAASGAPRDSGLKRLIDVVGALLGVVLLAPLLLLLALVVRLESPGPAIFRQRRSGLGGEPFVIFKFRTMRVAEDGLDIAQATRGDARITPFGSLLRRTSLDELPQLINVLQGRMSLVGPRPHALAHDALYGALIPEYRERFRARPGLTGLAQVSGFRGETPDLPAMAGRILLDIRYIETWSIGLDLRILARTVLGGPFHPKAY